MRHAPRLGGRHEVVELGALDTQARKRVAALRSAWILRAKCAATACRQFRQSAHPMQHTQRMAQQQSAKARRVKIERRSLCSDCCAGVLLPEILQQHDDGIAARDEMVVRNTKMERGSGVDCEKAKR